MTTDYDDIIERLTQRREFQINLKDVFNADDLEQAIKNSFPDDSRRNSLERNKDDLFETDTTQDSVVDNSVKLIEDAKSLQDLETTFDNITTSIGDIGKIREIEIESAQALKQRELFKEEPTRENIIGTGLKSVRKLSSELDLTIDETKDVLAKEGFELFNNDKQFKK